MEFIHKVVNVTLSTDEQKVLTYLSNRDKVPEQTELSIIFQVYMDELVRIYGKDAGIE